MRELNGPIVFCCLGLAHRTCRERNWRKTEAKLTGISSMGMVNLSSRMVLMVGPSSPVGCTSKSFGSSSPPGG